MARGGRAEGRGGHLEIEIERLAAGGEGVAHDRGRVVFVAAGAPGDRVEARLTAERESFARAAVVRVLRPSPHRVAPPCAAFGACGGCSWQHLSAAAQLEAKRAIVEDALRRLGRLEPPPLPPVVPSPRDYGYRHRALLHRADGPRGPVFGFYRQGTREVVAPGACPVLVPALERLLAALAPVARRHPRAFAGCTAVRVDAGWEAAALLVTALGRGGTPLELGPEVAAGVRGAAGPGVAVWPELAELRLGPGPDALVTTGAAFTQVNLPQNEALVRAALDLAAPRRGEEALDLCCGVGNLGVPAGRRGAVVHGVDLDPAAVALAGENARRAGIAGATFSAGDAAEQVRALAAAGRRFPLVLLNPPRTGARQAAAALPALAPDRVVYVSCDPATLARDAAVLVAAGWRLEAAVPFDLFPQTPLVETVALLRRADAR